MTKHLASLSKRGWDNTQCGGFTLLELLITIALIAIVMGIGVPSYQDFVVKNRIQTQASEIRSSLAMARVEAIRRGLWIRVCPGQDGCRGGNWHEGWNSFVDRNSNDIRTEADDETHLEVHTRLDGGSTLTGIERVVFLGDGTASAAAFPVVLTLCTADDHAQHRRRIEVTRLGRVRVCGPSDESCRVDC